MAPRARARRLALTALGAAVLALPAPTSAAPLTRYSLANGCFALQDASGAAVAGASQIRMQATALGQYLLYLPDRTFLTEQPDGSLAPATDPGPKGDWTVKEAAGGAFAIATVADGATHTVRFTPADGCAVYPEADLSATGTPFRGATPYGTVKGWMDGHLHWANYELLGGGFKCGKPWDPYGIPYALPDCASVFGPMSSTAPIQNFLAYGSPVAPHDTSGWPTLPSWSRSTIGTVQEGSYWRWMERVWMSGMRLMVMPVNDNRVLCELYAQHQQPCGEMATVTRALDDMRALQDYVDAQMGGPGKGFFQIVTNPFQARRVINEGKMAIVLEIEISELFDCRGFDDQTSNCSRRDVNAGLKSVYDRGVRSLLLLNKFDNPLAGVRFDGGPIGALINGGNEQSSGSYWSATTCSGPLHDNTIDYAGDGGAAAQAFAQSIGLQNGTLPTYPPAPDCNTRGLTDLGSYTVRRMMDRGMIVNPDHMSQKAVDQTLTLAESRHYAGVISPHGWMDPGNWPRIWKLGGLVRYAGGDVTGYAKEWRRYRPVSSPFLLGSPLGTDIAGLFAQPAPSPDAEKVMKYPFRSVDGRVRFAKQRTGERVFDYRTEGIAHYGLYADWLRDLQLHAPKRLIGDVMDGSEAYLDMWERAEGVAGPRCLPGDLLMTRAGLRNLRLGLRPEALLRRAGQPQRRTDAWTWCVRNGTGRRGPAATAVFTPAGRVGLVASTAPGHDVHELGPGDPVAALRGHARRAGHGLWLRREGARSFAFQVRRGRVALLAVTTRAIAARPALLRRYLRRARRTVARPLPFVPSPRASTRVAPGGTPPAAIGLSQRQLAHVAQLCSLLG